MSEPSFEFEPPSGRFGPEDEVFLNSEELEWLRRAARETAGMTAEEVNDYLDSGGYREA